MREVDVSQLLARIDGPKSLRALASSELSRLCAELRDEIIAICGRVGGHLGASLGAVELIVALHRVFRTPHDKLVFDVGHQAYAHKLLTGRRERMMTLRQADGVAPFPDPHESPHDAFVAGHACTAVSAALGLLEAGGAKGRRPPHVVAVIGDGSLTGGLTFEGLNNASVADHPLVIVLNDNGMSISANVGAVSKALRGAGGRALFESLGLTYLGPVDGHDVIAIEQSLREAKASNRPVVVHVRTHKGRGLDEAEADLRTRGHAMGPFELRDGKLVRSRQGLRTFSDAFAEVLAERMARDPRLVVVTPAMLEGSALVALKDRFPHRVHDVGIAEPHAVAFAAGLAAGGARPVCCIYSTFLQRAYDQVIHDVALPRLPVVLAVDRAGLVGADGATHQGAFDLAFLRIIPGLTVMVPATGDDLGPMLDTALDAARPVALRFPRAALPALPRGWRPGRAPVQGARWLKRASAPELTIVAAGLQALAALEAAEAMPRWSVLDPQTVAPLDEAAIATAAKCGALLVAEEGGCGGLGSAVLEVLAAQGLQPRVRLVGLPPRFVPHGDARQQRAELGLDAEGLFRAAKELLERSG